MASKSMMKLLSVLMMIVQSQSSTTCPQKVLTNTGVGGPGASAILNVSSMADCCEQCNTNYHDECVAWIYNEHPITGGYPSHNCAIMPHFGTPRQVANATSGVPSGTPPAPAPTPPSPPGKPCNADLDCNLLTDVNWRCEQSTAPESSDNNCHIPGPGTKGNNTCACSDQQCGSTPATPKNASAQVQYLMIGDSISQGMLNDVAALMHQHGWETTHNPGNAASSNLGAHCLSSWVTTQPVRKWDIISFNFGLHDLGYDTERISVQNYTTLMKEIIDDLVSVQKSTGTKLVWVDTTPVPTVPMYGPSCNDTSKCLNPPRFDADVVLYNAAAATLISDANSAGAVISTADLYTFVLKRCGGQGYVHCDGFQLPMNVHYTPEGWTALAAEMETFLLKA